MLRQLSEIDAECRPDKHSANLYPPMTHSHTHTHTQSEDHMQTHTGVRGVVLSGCSRQRRWEGRGRKTEKDKEEDNNCCLVASF